jgi:steroid delta-isomerase-like uncharacterized protein
MKTLLTIIPLALVLCFTVSCQDKAATAELEMLRAQAKVEQDNEALMTRAVEAYNMGDTKGLLELCSDDLRYYNPSNATEAVSKKVYGERIEEGLAAFPDSSITIEELTAKGDKVAARCSVKGTSKGEYQGIPPTGNAVSSGYIGVYTVKDGKVVEMREESDQLGLMLQLGMELKPKETKQSAIKPPPPLPPRK